MEYEAYAPLTGLKGATILKQRAINRYYSNPTCCKYCSTIIKIPKGKPPCIVKKKQFCNHSCAASFNNLGVNRWKTKSKRLNYNICAVCKGNTSKKAKMCLSCKRIFNRTRILNKTLHELYKQQYKNNSGVIWAQVRTWANRLMKEAGIEKVCAYCGIDYAIDCCHIKPISEFDRETTTVRDVNRLDNLIYLCKNHHWLFDKGRLDISEVKYKGRLVIDETVGGSSS